MVGAVVGTAVVVGMVGSLVAVEERIEGDVVVVVLSVEEIVGAVAAVVALVVLLVVDAPASALVDQS